MTLTLEYLSPNLSLGGLGFAVCFPALVLWLAEASFALERSCGFAVVRVFFGLRTRALTLTLRRPCRRESGGFCLATHCGRGFLLGHPRWRGFFLGPPTVTGLFLGHPLSFPSWRGVSASPPPLGYRVRGGGVGFVARLGDL